GGRVLYNWTADGLACELSVPSSKIKGGGKPKLPPKAVREGNGAPRKIANNRVMIVEDEFLVALELADSLTALGFSVVGPFTRVVEARRAIAEGDVDAAILDVNLSGQPIYPLAEELRVKGTPFVFVTGYDADVIDPQFRHVPVLQKPIEQ